jgi:hypothetical protein
MDKPILMGAVLYNPKVSVIWDIGSAFFRTTAARLIPCLHQTELQVEALLRGTSIA